MSVMDRPSVPEVLPLVRGIYRRHAAGCCLHIVADDGNVDDDDVEFCLTRAEAHQHRDCLQAAWMLLAMTKTQRRQVYHKR